MVEGSVCFGRAEGNGNKANGKEGQGGRNWDVSGRCSNSLKRPGMEWDGLRWAPVFPSLAVCI